MTIIALLLITWSFSLLNAIRVSKVPVHYINHKIPYSTARTAVTFSPIGCIIIIRLTKSESKVYIIVLSAVQDMNEKERKTLEVEIKEKLDSRSNALQKFKEEKTMLFY